MLMRKNISKDSLKRGLVGFFVVYGVFLASLTAIRLKAPTPQQTDIPSKEIIGEVITVSTDTPDEVKPDKATYKWQGAEADPKMVILPSIGAEGFVQKVGVDQNNQVAVPNNVHVAGWFTNSVLPGENGLSIIDGHVDGIKEQGIFEKIGKLQTGDIFRIELGNGKELNYKVLKVSSVATSEAAGILFSQDPTVTSQLNLITCGGTYSSQNHAYDQRVIVAAALQK